MRLSDDFHPVRMVEDVNRNPYATRTCASLNCSEPDGHGITLRFCPDCATRLAQIRSEFETAETGRQDRTFRAYGARYMLGDGERDDS